ncbi:MAG: RAMP superfamily CRISPR-associated protein [Desulfonauticus sp.]|nr:RAMP superfamily CRISPR-associated protein [Desulfonauticus sp.]
MYYEIVNEKITYDEKNPIHFLKWNFINTSKLKNFKERIQSSKQYEIPLNGNTNSNLDITNFSGIIKEDELQEFVSNLIPYSFILQVKIELKSPYFSRDDDNFYLIQNPCLKEKVFKVPMIKGSGWKGAIASAFRKIINESDNKKETIRSFMRIFGTGSNEFRELQKNIEKSLKENTNLEPDKLITYVLFELGLKLTKDDIDKIKTNPEEWIRENLWESFEKGSKKELPLYLTTHRGRAIFYPTYFNRLSLEIINPHDRKKRAGTNPIHYEVVPEETEGILQIVYVPFDGVLMKNDDLEAQIKNDIDFLVQSIEKAKDMGIGAKTKLGWGRFELITKKIKCNKNDITIPKGWSDE